MKPGIVSAPQSCKIACLILNLVGTKNNNKITGNARRKKYLLVSFRSMYGK